MNATEAPKKLPTRKMELEQRAANAADAARYREILASFNQCLTEKKDRSVFFFGEWEITCKRRKP